MMRAGRLTHRVTFRRRLELTDSYGNARGEFANLFANWPADYVRQSGSEGVEGGAPIDLRKGVLTVRDCPQMRDITAADRVVIEGVEHGIESVSLPDRRSRSIEMTVTTGGGP